MVRERPSGDGARPAIFMSVSNVVPRSRVNLLLVVSVVDAGVLAVLAWALLEERSRVAVVAAGAHASLLLLLVIAVAAGARSGWWGWTFVCAVLVLGPIAAVPRLAVLGRRG